MKRRTIRILFKWSYLVIALLIAAALVDAFLLEARYLGVLFVSTVIVAILLFLLLFVRRPHTHDMVDSPRYRQHKTVVFRRSRT